MFKLLESSKTDFFPGVTQRPGKAARGESWWWLPGDLEFTLMLLQKHPLLPFWKSHAFFDSNLVQLSYFKNQCLHF